MKILVSAKGKNKEDLMDTRFGRCMYFQIHDTESGQVKLIENGAANASGGAGVAAANQVIDEGVNVIITGNLGPNAFGLIEKSDIKAYKCTSMSVLDAIEKYNNGELEEISNSGPAHH